MGLNHNFYQERRGEERPSVVCRDPRSRWCGRESPGRRGELPDHPRGWKLARVGTPTIAISVADNQIINIEGLKKSEVIEYVGHWEDPQLFENIISIITKLKSVSLRREKRNLGRRLIDGKGSQRIVESILKASAYESHLSVKQ